MQLNRSVRAWQQTYDVRKMKKINRSLVQLSVGESLTISQFTEFSAYPWIIIYNYDPLLITRRAMLIWASFNIVQRPAWPYNIWHISPNITIHGHASPRVSQHRPTKARQQTGPGGQRRYRKYDKFSIDRWWIQLIRLCSAKSPDKSLLLRDAHWCGQQLGCLRRDYTGYDS